MSLLGKAAMLLSFDVVQEHVSEHDDWHTHEHLPERLGIPGFLRGTRWTVTGAGPRYMVLYEVKDLDVLTSAAYLERLNNPTPWTSKMMPHYRGMARGLCAVTGSFGPGTGHAAVLLRLRPGPTSAESLRRWLVDESLPRVAGRPGVGSAHLLEGARTPSMTREQRIRGADAGVDWALVVTGYREDALAATVQAELGRAQLESRGAGDVLEASYRVNYVLTHHEVDG